jgi:hypothetical protein
MQSSTACARARHLRRLTSTPDGHRLVVRRSCSGRGRPVNSRVLVLAVGDCRSFRAAGRRRWSDPQRHRSVVFWRVVRCTPMAAASRRRRCLRKWFVLADELGLGSRVQRHGMVVGIVLRCTPVAAVTGRRRCLERCLISAGWGLGSRVHGYGMVVGRVRCAAVQKFELFRSGRDCRSCRSGAFPGVNVNGCVSVTRRKKCKVFCKLVSAKVIF